MASQAMLESPVEAGSLEERLVDAALVCLARWGAAKTSLDDVAREAGVSRATAYRCFPGGKEALLDTVARTEVARFFQAVHRRLAEATSLEEILVAGIYEAGSRIAHHAALRTVVTYEPELVLPQLAFERTDRVLALAVELATPHLSRFLPAELAAKAAEWAARIVLSYASWPSVDVDLTDQRSVRRLVRAYVLPAFPDHEPLRGISP